MRATYTVGGEVFKTKKALFQRAQQLLRSLQVGPVDSQHNQFLYDLLQMHPNAVSKIGCGVKSFFVMKDDWGGKCFGAERIDGSKTDFSYRYCAGAAPTPWMVFVQAARAAVSQQIIEVKMAAFAVEKTIKCPLSGTDMTFETAHVDHEPPRTFEKLLRDFVEVVGLDPNDPPIAPCKDGLFGRVFSIEDVRLAWEAFHKEKAVLRVIHMDEHKRLTYKKDLA